MFPLKCRKLHKSTSSLTCSMCPLCRVELRYRSSHTSAILSDNQPAHHNQSHHSHIWTEKKPSKHSPTQETLKALQSCHTCFILPWGDPALLWPMANHSCMCLCAVNCGAFRGWRFWNASFISSSEKYWQLSLLPESFIHYNMYCMLKHGEIKISGMFSLAPATQIQQQHYWG